VATADWTVSRTAVLRRLRQRNQGIPEPGETPNAEEGQEPAGREIRPYPADEGHDCEHPDDLGGVVGFPIDESEERGSFKGTTTRDIYTKGAHFALLKELLPRGSIVLTTEQEATLPPLLPRIFDAEIREDRFAWLAMSFNKKATKPEKIGKVKEYRKARKQFHNDGMYAGRFDPVTDAQTVTEAFIADRMDTALRGSGARFQISNYQSVTFPSLWVRSSTQASGEIDKTVGFPILPRHLRRTLKNCHSTRKSWARTCATTSRRGSIRRRFNRSVPS
jgi:hypothetical protein